MSKIYFVELLFGEMKMLQKVKHNDRILLIF